jgi:putative PIN family toxin of toxin-antitoxin system
MQAGKAGHIMLKVVLDTNVIVSAVITPMGNPAKIMGMLFDEKIQAYYCAIVMAEYKSVLARVNLGITIHTQAGIIDAIENAGVLIEPTTSNRPFIDESDRVFYDTAKESGAILITGNIRHYPAEDFVMTPARFLDFIEGQ